MKPSQVLRETKVPQIKHRLIKFVGNEMIGKCAMGVLACESGNPDLQLTKERLGVDYEAIMYAYGIETITGYPTLDLDQQDWDFDTERLGSLIATITGMNDFGGFTFEQIAEFLEVTFDL